MDGERVVCEADGGGGMESVMVWSPGSLGLGTFSCAVADTRGLRTGALQIL